MIWASQEDIHASFPSSTVFVSSLWLSSWQRAALMCDEVVSLLPEKSSNSLCQAFPAAFLHIRSLFFMPVFCSNCNNCIFFTPHTNVLLMYFHQSSQLLHCSDNGNIFPTSRDFFLRTCFCRSLSVDAAKTCVILIPEQCSSLSAPAPEDLSCSSRW